LSNYDEIAGNKVLVDFNVTSINAEEMYIQLNFTDPTLIARFSVIDSCLIC